MRRITKDIRIDVDLDEYIRQQACDPFRQAIVYGMYSDIVNDAIRAWMTEHKKLAALAAASPMNPETSHDH